eukprot:4975951-Pleurochrysis_carterae.AAC.1
MALSASNGESALLSVCRRVPSARVRVEAVSSVRPLSWTRADVTPGTSARRETRQLERSISRICVHACVPNNMGMCAQHGHACMAFVRWRVERVYGHRRLHAMVLDRTKTQKGTDLERRGKETLDLPKAL